jgi:hypothetical protein
MNNDLHHAGNSGPEAVPFLARGLLHAEGGVLVEARLTVLLGSGAGVVGGDLVPAHVERRQDVAVVGVLGPEVARPLQEDGPRRDPQPELALLVLVERQVVGLRGVALEEPRLRGRDVHHVEVRGVGEQLDVFVRAGRRRGHVAVGHARRAHAGAVVAGEQRHELAERLRPAEATEDRGLVQ